VAPFVVVFWMIGWAMMVFGSRSEVALDNERRQREWLAVMTAEASVE